VQPRGPYRLAGFCVGGIVAFEMAQQLIASGEEPPMLALVETGIPVPFRCSGPSTRAAPTGFSGSGTEQASRRHAEPSAPRGVSYSAKTAPSSRK
jgi:thioesterase domain-containing protein